MFHSCLSTSKHMNAFCCGVLNWCVHVQSARLGCMWRGLASTLTTACLPSWTVARTTRSCWTISSIWSAPMLLPLRECSSATKRGVNVSFAGCNQGSLRGVHVPLGNPCRVTPHVMWVWGWMLEGCGRGECWRGVGGWRIGVGWGGGVFVNNERVVLGSMR